MKVGVYFSGLGQSVIQDSVEAYSERLMNQMRYSETGAHYRIKLEKILISKNLYSNVARISKQDTQSGAYKCVYKLYEFNYIQLLTKRFSNSSLFKKNLLLLLFSIRMTIPVVRSFFSKRTYKFPFTALYLILLLLMLSIFVVMLVPGVLLMSADYFGNFGGLSPDSQILSLIVDFINPVVAFSIPITTLLLLFPNSENIITTMATEFVAANNYIKYGDQKQDILGNLEEMVEYIIENEAENCSIHFHAYSFGSLIAYDFLFPHGSKVTRNADRHITTLITIGTPVEFLRSYYPEYVENRNLSKQSTLIWINVYSLLDALSSNFRTNLDIGPSEYGFTKDSLLKPINLNYELIPKNSLGVIDFLLFLGLKAHSFYWVNSTTDSQSCLTMIFQQMHEMELIET